MKIADLVTSDYNIQNIVSQIDETQTLQDYSLSLGDGFSLSPEDLQFSQLHVKLFPK